MARNTVGGVLPSAQRGQYTIIGTPRGSALRPGWAQGQNVLGGQIFTGQGGTRWVFRRRGPQGAGWYRSGNVPGSAPGAPSPTQAGRPMGGFPAGSLPASAAQFTLPPEPPPAAGTTAAPTPPPAPPPTPWAPDPNWWMQQFQATPDYQTQAPQIAAQENQTAARFGYSIRRDTTQGSPTYGQALYRPRGAEAGSGDVRAILEVVPGSVPPTARYVYKDASGKEYAAGDLEMDVVELQPGEAGYREGELGRSQMESRAAQADIGTGMAQRGLRSSGIRAGAAVGEVQRLLDSLRALSGEAGAEFTGTTSRWMDLFNQIYPGLSESAQGLYEASVAPPPGSDAGDGGAGDGGEAAPEAPAAPTGPQFTFGGQTFSQGDRVPPGPNGIGKFTRKGSKPSGAPDKPPAGTLHRGSGGVWFVYRPSGPNGAGWYRQP